MAITDNDSAKAWLEKQSDSVQLAFAARCALRAVPGLGGASAVKLSRVGVPTLRALQAACSAVVFPSESVIKAASLGSHNLHRLDGIANRDISDDIAAGVLPKEARGSGNMRANSSATLATAYCVSGLEHTINHAKERYMSSSGAMAAGSAASAAEYSDVRSGGPAARAAAYSACDADAQFLAPAGGQPPDPWRVFELPLWPTETRNYIPPGEPDGLAENYRALKTLFEEEPEHWEFWHRWLEGMRNGQPLNWDLQKEIALGLAPPHTRLPKGAAEKIREIEARFELKQRLREAEKEMARDAAQRLGIGGNNPPEAIDDYASWPKELTVVWAPIQTLKEEADAEKPDKGRVSVAISALLELAASCGLYVAQKADLAIDTAIKWGIPAAATALIASRPEIVTKLIEAAQKFASTLP